MENTTQKENELINNTYKLKPEQMESGKWYVIEAKYKWLCKFSRIELDAIFTSMHHSYTTDYKALVESCIVNIRDVDNIIPATNEEVLKHFPDEFFEPIELRPEELVSGEVYTIEDYNGRKWTFRFDRKENNYLHYFKMLFQIGMDRYSNNWIAHIESDKIFHATPEEKALLLGEEQTDWKAKFEELKDKYTKLEAYNDELTEKINELQKEYDRLKKDCEKETDLRRKWADNFFSLKEEYNELFKKQSNQEKVYFFTTQSGDLRSSSDIETAKVKSGEDYRIYEALKIGVKKSVLVNEN